MFIREVELFRDLGSEFMGEVAKVATEESFPTDHVIFRAGDSAEYIYILREGRVKVFVQEGGSINTVVDKAGGIFGWSALVEPNEYTATSQCYTETRVVKISRNDFEEIAQRYPRESYIVMKRLAGVVGQRLVTGYKEILRSRREEAAPSYG